MSVQLTIVDLKKNTIKELEDIKDEIINEYFGDNRSEYFQDHDNKDYKDGAIEAADYIIKIIDKHITKALEYKCNHTER